jgi:hypothetical protein
VRPLLAALALAPVLLVVAASPAPGAPEGCVACHAGIEEMHPWRPLTCTQCHGGNASAATKDDAHVRPSKPFPNDERTLPRDWDPAFLRFQNPANLRVAADACGECHPAEVENLGRSLHGTTAGHLSDGLYENGVARKKTESWGIFPGGGLSQVPAFSPRSAARGAQPTIADHYLDLPRKACMQCHIWSRGRAVRGRLGMDGDYRSEGCAACHVVYDTDGLSRSADPTVNKLEPGHPRRHEMTSKVPTSQCVTCHYGDASIGASYRGLAQLVPGMPAGPDIPGTTKSRLNGVFYVQDPGVNPPDIHHEKGMHCIDCHTFNDVMGDGKTPTKMEMAVEVECADCHGTFEKPATRYTQKGTKLEHLRAEGGRVILRSKVDGEDHVVPQAIEVLTPGSERYNPRAALAMDAKHAKVECYACHAGWSPNFFGFHFDRNEGFTQLEVLSGERTPGRVSTQEKVFATFRNLLFGWSPEGTVQPYMVGFSTMGTVHGKDGKKVIDQGMPRTAAGLSGMTLVHHNLHTTRPAARACVECHRNDEALGLGSPNFRLARDFAFATSARGLETIGLDRGQIEMSLPVATLAMKGAREVALQLDVVDAHARVGLVAREDGLAVVDLRSPAFPREVGSVKLAEAWAVEVRGSKAYVAAGKDGLAVVDIERPERPRLLGKTGKGDARRLALAGFHAYVLDATGANALAVVDVSDPAAPKEVASVALADEGRDDAGGEPGAVATWWQWSRPDATGKGRTQARRVVAVASTRGVIQLVDATEPSAPKLVPRDLARGGQGQRLARGSVRTLVYGRHYDLGTEGGGVPSVERDYLYVGVEEERANKDTTFLVTLDVTDPARPQPRGRVKLPNGDLRALRLAHVYNPPFVQSFVLTAGQRAGVIVDVSRSEGQLTVVGRVGGEQMREFTSVAVEEMAFDRLVDWDGRPEKDISHPGARYFSREEALRLLRAPLPAAAFAPPAAPEPARGKRPPARPGQGTAK